MDNYYQLIIVEDDDDIREGLARIINWNELGFMIVGLFCCAEDAQGYLLRNNVDAVLTDICMGDTSGLDLAQWVFENQPDTHTIILSGYSDFKYASTAIDCHVYKYLLKPTDPGKFRRTFTQLYSILSKEKMGLIQQRKTSHFCLKLLLKLVIYGEFGLDKVLWLRQIALGDNIDSGWIYFRIVHTGHEENMDTLFYNAFEGHEDFCMIPVCSGQSIMALALPRNQGILSDQVYDLESHINKAIAVIHDIMDIQLMITEFTSDMKFENIEEKLLCESRDAFNAGQEITKLHKLADTFEDISKEDVNELIHGIDKNTKKLIRDISSLLLAELWEKPSLLADGKVEIEQLASLKKQKFCRFLHMLIDQLSCDTDDKLNTIVGKACYYIRDAAGRVVSLKETAEHVYVNPSYLSKIFHEEMGVTFKEYAINVAIEHAKRLLTESDYKIYEIANVLGYKDKRSFYTMFQKNIGMTPTQYRKLHGQIG